MAWEVEQKFVANDLAAIRQALDAAGVVWEPSIPQTDQYWNHPSRDFARTDEALRLRQVGQQNWLTYKGPRIDATTKTRQEIETPLPDGAAAIEQLGQILAAVGFRPVATVRKNRSPGSLTWKGQTIHVALDCVDGVGNYVELEIVASDRETIEPAKSRVVSLAKSLGLAEIERRSYLELLLAKHSKASPNNDLRRDPRGGPDP